MQMVTTVNSKYANYSSTSKPVHLKVDHINKLPMNYQHCRGLLATLAYCNYQVILPSGDTTIIEYNTTTKEFSSSTVE